MTPAALPSARLGVTFILGDAPLTALIQATVPNHRRGRALVLLGTMRGLAAPVGLLAAVPLGDRLGVRWLFVLTGKLGTFVCQSIGLPEKAS